KNATMKVGPLEVLLCVTCAIVMNKCEGVTVPCLACSYTFAGDGTRDRECVTDVLSNAHTKVVNCTSGRCYIKAVYAHDYLKLDSLSRGCNFDTSDSDKCDPPTSMIPTCQMVCSSDQCNSQHGDIWSSKKHDNGDASLAHCNHYLVFVGLFFCVGFQTSICRTVN
ncbi:unnamed protein product, partial [Candidula unifasciata]